MTDLVQRTPEQQLVARVRGDDFKQQVAMTLPPTVTADRFVRIATTAIMTNPEIAKIPDQNSILRAFVKAAADGLMPDGKEAAIVKRGDQAVYQPMVGGFRKIAAEHGWTLRARVVYANDEFGYTEEPPTLLHNPVRPGVERGDLIAAYAIATHKDGRREQRVMYGADILKRRELATTKQVWDKWPAEMWQKTVVRDLFADLPLADTDLVQRLLKADELEPGEAARLIYGTEIAPDTTAAPTTAARPVEQPGATDAGGAGQEAASAPASSATSTDTEPEPDIGDAGGFNSPDGVSDDELVIAAKHAALVEIPNGKHKGMTLGELVEKGDEATGWIRWALRNIDQPDDYRIALWSFARVYAPDVFQQVAAEKEAAA